MDNKVIIYGRSTCPFCVYTVDFCEAKNLEYTFLDYVNREEILKECKDFYKQDTVPIILLNNIATGIVKKVGGYSDLLEYFNK
tara:strand:+ start:2660 stop:2908 length:249 start_codon:yes stop_codon:yes gene_type:complete